MRFNLIICFVLFSRIVEGQGFSIGFGPIYTLTNQKVEMINSQEDFQNTDYQIAVNYEYLIKNSKYLLICSLTKFNGHTWIKFKEGTVIGSDGFPTLGVGYSGVKILKVDFGSSYNFEMTKLIFFQPYFKLGLQISNPDGSEYGAFEKQNGPDYVELKPITAESFRTTQFVPSLGFKTGALLWKQIELGLTIQGTLGFKSYQNMYFNYSYKGVPQETAVFEAKGTGIFTALSIGYKFVKQNK